MEGLLTSIFGGFWCIWEAKLGGKSFQNLSRTGFFRTPQEGAGPLYYFCKDGFSKDRLSRGRERQ